MLEQNLTICTASLSFEIKLGQLAVNWKVIGNCSDCMSEGVDLDFAVEVDVDVCGLVKVMHCRICLLLMVLWKWAVSQR